jgi:hypothetical protein
MGYFLERGITGASPIPRTEPGIKASVKPRMAQPSSRPNSLANLVVARRGGGITGHPDRLASVLGVTDSDVHCKALSQVPNRDAYVSCYQRLEDGGCGQTIVTVTDERICLQKYETLRHWVDQRAIDGRLPRAVRLAMGHALRELLERVHGLGFCHGDIHIGNFVVRDGAPLLVDPKYAIEHCGRPCYDLAGPEGSGVEIASEHVSQTDNRNHDGVWWENADPLSEALISTFGPVADVKA